MRRNKHVIAFLILLLLFSSFVAVAHYHADRADHHGCLICIVSHHQPVAGPSAAPLSDAPCFIEIKHILPTPVIIEKVFISFLNNRAPPA